MKVFKFWILTAVPLFLSCSEYRKETVNIPVSGINETYDVIRVIDSDSLILDEYKSGGKFLKVLKEAHGTSTLEEVYFYYEDGSIMEYKYYLNDELIYFARYDLAGKIYRVNGYPIIHLEDMSKTRYVDINIALVYKALAIVPPKTKMSKWHGGNDSVDPYEQITMNQQNLKKRYLIDDTLGFIFSVPDTATHKFTTLWCLHDSISDSIIQAGRLITKFKGKNTGQ